MNALPVRRTFAAVAQTPERVYWACVAGIFVWAVLRQLGIDRDAAPIRFWPFLTVIAVASVNLALRNRYSAHRRHRESIPTDRQSGPLSWVFVGVDFATIVAGLRFSGGVHSAIWVVSFVVLAGETVLERRREATITRFAACAAILLGTIPLPSEHPDWPAYLLDMFVRMGLLIAVSSVMRRLRERSEAALAEITGLRAELALAEQRAALAREVHDGVGNSLAASVLRLELAARLREREVPGDPVGSMLRDEAGSLRQTMTAVRDWTFATRPWPAADGEPAEVVLQRELGRFSNRTGLPVETEGAALLDTVPDLPRTALLRIAQEALTNAAKHARGATRAELRFERDERALTMTVADDGCGFDPATGGSGVGMASMRERAEGIGARLDVVSQPGAGTRIAVRLPSR